MLGYQLVQHLLDADDLAGVDVEVGSLALEAAAGDQRLMHVDARVGQREPAAFVAGHQDHGAKARGPADGHSRDRRLDVLHGVVDREPGRDGTAGGVDVDLNLLVRVVGLEKDQLGDDQVGDHVVDGPAEQDDAVAEEAGA